MAVVGQPLSAGTTPRKNPYVGPRPFQKGQTLYGREAEREQLQRLLVSERIVLLHSPSGAGKSSLINAALLPKLPKRFRAEDPLTIGRPAGVPERQGSALLNYIARMRESAEVEKDLATRLILRWNTRLSTPLGEAECRRMTLAGFARRALGLPDPDASAESGVQQMTAFPVVTFDQFEDVFTGFSYAPESVERLFQQLGEMLADKRIWALFAMRDDYIGHLEPFADLVPGAFRARYRLEPLDPDQAREAVEKPAKEEGVTFPSANAEELVRRLRQTPGSPGEERHTARYVEPVLLQVVCTAVWNHLPDGAAEVPLSIIPGEQQINDAIGEYYAEVVRKAAAKCGVGEAPIRRWCGTQLIQNHVRAQVRSGPMGGEPDAGLLAELEKRYLIRRETRGEAAWFELVHDRLVDPILENNRRWELCLPQDERLLRTAAQRWRENGESDYFLLRGRALEDAEDWARTRAGQLTPEEKAFLTRSLAHRRWARLSKVMIVVAALMIAAMVVFIGQSMRAHEQALSQEQKANELQQRADKASRSAADATRRADLLRARAEDLRVKAEQMLRQVQAERIKNEKLRGRLSIRNKEIRAAQIALDDAAVEQRRLGSELKGREADLKAAKANLDGAQRAADESGRKADESRRQADALRARATMRLAAAAAMGARNHREEARRVIAGLRRLVSQYGILEPDAVAILPELLQLSLEQRTFALPAIGLGMSAGGEAGKTVVVTTRSGAVRFAADGSGTAEARFFRLCCGSSGMRLVVDHREPKSPPPGCAAVEWPTSVTASPQGDQLLTGFPNGRVFLWSWDGERNKRLPGHRHPIVTMAFSDDEKLIASASAFWSFSVSSIGARPFQDKPRRVYRWPNVVNWVRIVIWGGGTELVRSVRFLGRRDAVAAGFEDGRVELWSTRRAQRHGERAYAHTDAVLSLSANDTGNLLVSTGREGSVAAWDIESAAGTAPRLKQRFMRAPEESSGPAVSSAVDDSGALFALGFASGVVEICDARDGAVLARIPAHRGRANAVGFVGPDLLASTGDDRATLMWRVPALAQLRELRDICRELESSVPEPPTEPMVRRWTEVLDRAEAWLARL